MSLRLNELSENIKKCKFIYMIFKLLIKQPENLVAPLYFLLSWAIRSMELLLMAGLQPPTTNYTDSVPVVQEILGEWLFSIWAQDYYMIWKKSTVVSE